MIKQNISEAGICVFIKVKVGVHQGSVLSLLLFAIVLDVIIENTRRVMINVVLNANDLVLMSETKEELKERFWN